ncbi:MAG: alpha/beta fold hydrolase [Thermoflexales bacterium]
MKRALRLLLGILSALALQLVVFSRLTLAEVPVLESAAVNGDYGVFEHAQLIPEPWFMWFVLGELSHGADVDMVAFDYAAGEPFRAMVFIPGHEELRSFSPTLALIGPGLPMPDDADDLPFALPPGMGAVVASSDSTYRYFDVFTQMVYFPRARIEITMPQSGRYYVAVWGRPVGMARYALDIGVMENFAPHVLVRYPINWWEVRDYLRWGHLPAVIGFPLLSVVLRWAARRLRMKDTWGERALACVNLAGFAAVLIGINVQQVSYADMPLITFSMLGLMMLALLGSFVCSAYFLTPLREHMNLRDVAPDDCFVWVNGYAIHYTDEGDRHGVPVVLIHGFAASVFSWRLVRRALSTRGYRVVAVDLIGSGASARPAEPIYTTEMQARVVLGVMDQLGLRQAHVVGHSFGGRVAMQIALLAPERVLKLVVIAPEAFATGRPSIARWVSVPILGYVLAFYSTLPLLVRSGLRWVSRRHAWITAEVLRGYALPLRVRASALAQVWQARSPKDGFKPVPAHLTEITQETLVMWGDRDPVFPASDGERLRQLLPRAELVVFHGVGHLVHEEHPDETIGHLLRFLTQ